MKHLTLIFNLLLFPFLFILHISLPQKSSLFFHLRRGGGKGKLITTLLLIFGLGFTFSYADGDNGTCAKAETIGEMDNITTSKSHHEIGTVNNAGNDYFTFTVDASGSLDINIQAIDPENRNYTFYIANGTCDTWNVYNGTTATLTHTKNNITINSGDTIYVRVHANGHKSKYNIGLDFTAANNSAADLKILENAAPLPNPADIGQDVTFNIRTQNRGPDTALKNIVIKVSYNQNVNITSAAQTAGGGFTCDKNSGSLAAGAFITCTKTSDWNSITNDKDFTFVVQPSTSGALTQKVTIASDITTDPDPFSNTMFSSVTVNVVATLFTAVDDSFTTSANTSLTDNLFTNDIGIVSGVVISSVDISSLEGSIVFTSDTGAFTYDPPSNWSGTTTFTYTISDGSNTSTAATVEITVSSININAVDDSFDTYPDVTLRGNILQNDTGLGIEYTSLITPPTQGTLTIEANGDFIYIPDGGYRGDDTFVYEITDTGNNTDQATVTITIATAFTSGSAIPFTLVNPDYARNVIGDYKIAGNTVLCLTEHTETYGGTCHGDTDYQNITSNMHIVKYIDIDSNSGTWNSSSSYIDLDNTPYDSTRGIVWAGLFWAGRISSSNTYPIRYYTENGASAVTAHEVGKDGGSWDSVISTIGTQNIKLKIDTGSYNNVIASTFHTAGQTYAAYADVSSVLQAASLSKSKHVFTVANLTTMEGREGSPGAFGGWSLVVVYAETHEYGKPRNISIYNGFVDIGTNDTPITISGFKLPTTGDVLAQLSVFSGEGEHLYGYRSGHHDKADWMKISNDGTNFAYMPGLTLGDHVGNRDNSFNAQLDNILRDDIAGEYNDLAINNVGVDIDNYNVSDLMTGYRDADENISEITIQTYSDWDYITTSMIAFSAELYVPELCYDYTLDIGGHVVDSVDNLIQTPFGGLDVPLTSALYLKSLEGDIDLTNVNVHYNVGNIAQAPYLQCPTDITYLSETGQYDYTPSCYLVHAASDNGFSMRIGKDMTATGGTISALESRYIKFNSKLKTSVVDTYFDFSVSYSVDYGSGAVPITKVFTADDLCDPTSNGYMPETGTFNIVDGNADYDEWNLYTQVTKRPFNLRLYAYAFDSNDYLTPMLPDADLNLSVEIEVIRADNFGRDANTACNDEHSILSDVPAKFLNFTNDGNGEMVEFGYNASDLDFAYRSVAMRIWYLTDVDSNGTLIDNHNCTRGNQDECVELYNSQYKTGDTSCAGQCQDVGSTGNCYDCLRTNYGRKVCSRDNFAIRPEAFITQIYDSDENASTLATSNHIANSIATASAFSLVSGYEYRFDINSTNHTNDIATTRYIQHFEPGSPTHHISMNWWPDTHTVSGCNDVSDKNISLNIYNGSTISPISPYESYTDKVDQIGKYRFEVYDENWTSADWDTTQMRHHEAPPASGEPGYNPVFKDYSDYYIDGSDCIEPDLPNGIKGDIVTTVDTGGRQGCVISSVHHNNNTDVDYLYLYAQYYPYKFDINGSSGIAPLRFGARPNNDGTNDAFIYINTQDFNLHPDGIDENMSYNIQQTFAAMGKDYGRLSNFVDNCYAEDVNMSLYQNYNHVLPTQDPVLSYELTDYESSDASDVIRARNFNYNYASASTDPLIIKQLEQHFRKDMNGSITMDLGYNFVRTNDTPRNPRYIHMRDFNITYSTPPADIFVDLNKHHKIFGNINLDQNVTFAYGRVKPAKTLYDDITDPNVDTPVSVVLYCDLGYAECQNRRINALFGQTNDANWWKAVDHDQGNNDGNIELVSVPAGALNSTTVSINSNGIDETVNVNNGGVVPLTVPVNLVVDDLANIGPTPYTDRWLIFNPESATLPPIPFYRVRFIGSTGWVGFGDTGHVVGGTVNEKKNRRLEW